MRGNLYSYRRTDINGAIYFLDTTMPLDVCWATLKLLWTLLNGMKVHKITYPEDEWKIYIEKLKPLFANGVSGIPSIRKLKEEINNLASKL